MPKPTISGPAIEDVEYPSAGKPRSRQDDVVGNAQSDQYAEGRGLRDARRHWGALALATAPPKGEYLARQDSDERSLPRFSLHIQRGRGPAALKARAARSASG